MIEITGDDFEKRMVSGKGWALTMMWLDGTLVLWTTTAESPMGCANKRCTIEEGRALFEQEKALLQAQEALGLLK